MNLFTISCLMVVFSTLFIGLFIAIKGRDRLISLHYALVCIGAAIWSVGGYIFSIANSRELAFVGWQIAHMGMIFTPPLFMHFVCKFSGFNRKRHVIISYSLALIFVGLNFFNKELFLGDLRLVFNQFYWITWSVRKSWFYIAYYVLFYHFLLLYSFVLLIKFYNISSSITRNRIKYIILASLIGWFGPHGMFLLVFGIKLYPFPNFLIAIYPLIFGYAVVRHQLMDINIVIKKGLVYSILVAVITGVYLVFILGVGRLFQDLVGYQSFVVNLVAIFTIGILFNPLRNRIQRFLDRRFFQGTLESLSQDRERLQQQLYQKEKLAYVGQLASSVAHEIRNPLTAIKTYTEYMPKKYNDPDFRDKFNSFVPQEINRIEKIIYQLLDLAKPRKPIFVKTDIKGVIDSTLSLLENQFILKRINILRNYKDGDAIINGDPEQLRQVFLNLFLNAMQAMGEEGTLTVKVETKDRRQKTKDQRPKTQATDSKMSSVYSLESAVSNNSVQVIIEDTGVGISERNIENLFTPFQTTKKDGIGLGLVIAQEIISAHKGTIRAESKVGEGTKFIIELPVLT